MDQQIVALLRRRQKEHAKDGVVAYIGTDEERLSALIGIVYGEDSRLSQFASWPLSELVVIHPEMIAPYHGRFLESLQDPSCPGPIRRNLIRLYQWAEIPEEMEGPLYDRCIQFLADPEEAIAVKAFGSSVALRIVQRYPDLEPELRSLIEQQYDYASSGLKNRFGKVLAALEQIA